MFTEDNTFLALVCVDGVENEVPSGRFYHGDLSLEHFFSGTDRLLLDVEAMLDGREPVTPGAKRTNEAVWQPGKIATFRIHIMFRRNASWQGSIMWLETRHEDQFRSELELLFLIRQALIPAQKQRMCPSSLKITK